MIVPMKKFTVIVQEKDADSAIKKLRRLGVMHIEHQQAPAGKDIVCLQDDLALVNEALGILSQKELCSPGTNSATKAISDGIGKYKIPPYTAGVGLEGVQAPLPRGDRERSDRQRGVSPYGQENSEQRVIPSVSEEFSCWRHCARLIIDLYKRIDRLQEYAHTLNQRIEQWLNWGDFDPEAIQRLKEKNMYVRLYQVPEKQLKEFPESVLVKRIFSSGGIINCVAISQGYIEVPFKEAALPKIGLEAMRKRLEEDKRMTDSLKDELCKSLAYDKGLSEVKRSLEKELEFHQVLKGMGREESLAYVAGYIPFDAEDLVVELAKKQAWAFFISEPSEDDPVPTLIRNPAWVSLISPVFRVIEVIPGYRELDISLCFLLFLSVFFGILIGDAGYGLVYLTLTFWAQCRFGKKIKEKAVFYLFYIFSFCAILWGLLTASFFGQEWLMQRSLRPLVPALGDDRNVRTLCFFIGAFHLSIAHIWRAILQFPSLVFLTDLGWICILWGAFFLVRVFILGASLPVFGPWLIYSGMVLVVLFSNPRKNILKGIGAGIGTLLLNVVNNFTDVVSYIRLFAVGLAGIAVADAFNKMAAGVGFGGVFPALLSLFILLAGHGLNLILGPMSVLVHGVRLNVLEFCGHLDVKWSGFAYRPLQEESV